MGGTLRSDWAWYINHGSYFGDSFSLLPCNCLSRLWLWRLQLLSQEPSGSPGIPWLWRLWRIHKRDAEPGYGGYGSANVYVRQTDYGYKHPESYSYGYNIHGGHGYGKRSAEAEPGYGYGGYSSVYRSTEGL